MLNNLSGVTPLADTMEYQLRESLPPVTNGSHSIYTTVQKKKTKKKHLLENLIMLI